MMSSELLLDLVVASIIIMDEKLTRAQTGTGACRQADRYTQTDP